jgi:hypothetical protein
LKVSRDQPLDETGYGLKQMVKTIMTQQGVNIISDLDSKNWADVNYQARDVVFPRLLDA